MPKQLVFSSVKNWREKMMMLVRTMMKRFSPAGRARAGEGLVLARGGFSRPAEEMCMKD